MRFSTNDEMRNEVVAYAESRNGATFRKSPAQRHDAARDDALDVNTVVRSRGKGAADKFAGPCVRSADCWSSRETDGSGAKGGSRIGGHGSKAASYETRKDMRGPKVKAMAKVSPTHQGIHGENLTRAKIGMCPTTGRTRSRIGTGPIQAQK